MPYIVSVEYKISNFKNTFKIEEIIKIENKYRTNQIIVILIDLDSSFPLLNILYLVSSSLMKLRIVLVIVMTGIKIGIKKPRVLTNFKISLSLLCVKVIYSLVWQILNIMVP